MNEVWKDIDGYKGLYQVSNLGRVKRVSHTDTHCRQGFRVFKERLLKPYTTGKEYLTVRLSKNNKCKSFYVHRLVAEAFIPNPDNLPQINHIDENPRNNATINLEWCTQKYNCNYGNHCENMRKIAKETWARRKKNERYTRT